MYLYVCWIVQHLLKERMPRGEGALLNLVKIIYISFNDTCKARVFFNNFRQAFDLVENDILLRKLKLHEPVLGVRESTQLVYNVPGSP